MYAQINEPKKPATLFTRPRQLKNTPPVYSEAKKTINIKAVHWDSQSIDHTATAIGKTWQNRGGNPNKDKTAAQCSGTDWNNQDEGIEIARKVAAQHNRRPRAIDGSYSKTFMAYYHGQSEPIAIMQLEMRQKDNTNPQLKHLYIRWLLASPVNKGGGTALVNLAKAEALKHTHGELRVDAARTALPWYKKQGFKKLYQSKHNDPDKDCGCTFMRWSNP